MIKTMTVAVAALAFPMLAGAANAALVEDALVSGPALLDYAPGRTGFAAFEAGALTSPFGATSVTATAETGFASGDFAILGEGVDEILTGTLSGVEGILDATGEDILELSFTVTGGTEANRFGGTGASVLTAFTGDLDSGGMSEFFTDGAVFAQTRLTVSSAAPAPIPLPATFPLMAAALAGVGFVTRLRR